MLDIEKNVIRVRHVLMFHKAYFISVNVGVVPYCRKKSSRKRGKIIGERGQALASAIVQGEGIT